MYMWYVHVCVHVNACTCVRACMFTYVRVYSMRRTCIMARLCVRENRRATVCTYLNNVIIIRLSFAHVNLAFSETDACVHAQ